MAGSNFGLGLGERGLSLFPARPGGTVGMHVVTGLTPDLTDAATRESNRAAIQNAINTVGAAGGGIVFIPAGHYYLQQANTNAEQAAIYINHDNITLRGAGIGRTVLHTRQAFSNVSGRCIRGHGIQIGTTRGPTRSNVTLEQFELTADLGHTGNYNWPASATTGDGWDVTNKGIIIGWDAASNAIALRDIYVHGYRGEIIYTGGWGNNEITLQRVYSHDSNGSSYNFLADNVLVEDCTFGDGRFWIEIANTNVSGSTVIRRCTFHRSNRAGDAGVAFADMAGNNTYLIEDCRFIDTAGSFIGLFGNIGVNVSIEVRDCFFYDGTSVILPSQIYSGVNRNATFRNNRVLDVGFFYWGFGQTLQNSIIEGNDFDGTGGNFFFHSNGNHAGTVISNNTYRNTGALSGGTPSVAPSYINNTAAGPISDTQRPSVPSGLTANVGTRPEVFLQWNESTDNIGVRGYRVYRGTNGGGLVQIAETPYRWYMDRGGLTSGTSYTYAISARDLVNESARSTTVDVTTL